MAIEDFYGTWNVQVTTKTPSQFSSLRIEKPTDREIAKNDVLIFFAPGSRPPAEGTYDPSTESIEIVAPQSHTYISRYITDDQTYRAIYGLTLGVGSEPAVPESAVPESVSAPVTVWGAALAPGGTPAVSTTTKVVPSPFDNSYRVRAAIGTGYGIGSTLKISLDGSQISIENAAGMQLPAPDSLIYNLETDSLTGVRGRGTDQEEVNLWSVATHDSKKYLYGLVLWDADGDGWPEQGGACGAEEEPDPLTDRT